MQVHIPRTIQCMSLHHILLSKHANSICRLAIVKHMAIQTTPPSYGRIYIFIYSATQNFHMQTTHIGYTAGRQTSNNRHTRAASTATPQTQRQLTDTHRTHTDAHNGHNTQAEAAQRQRIQQHTRGRGHTDTQSTHRSTHRTPGIIYKGGPHKHNTRRHNDRQRTQTQSARQQGKHTISNTHTQAQQHSGDRT